MPCKTRTRFLAFAVAALSASVAPPLYAQPADPPADDSAVTRGYLTGNGLLSRGMYELAAAEYRQFLAEHVDHEKAVVARYGLGVALFRLKDYAGAEAELTKIADAPRFEFGAETALLIGQCRLARQQYAPAADAFDRLLREYAKSPLADDAASLRVEALYRAGEFDEALAAAKAHAERFKASPLGARTDLFAGLSLMAKSDFAGAAKRFEAVVRRPDQGELGQRAAFLLAQCQARTGGADAAMQQYRRILETADSPFIPDALLGLAELLHEGGQAKEAAPLLDRLIKDFPKSSLVEPARLRRGRVWFDLGEYDKARALFKEVEHGSAGWTDETAYWTAKCDLRAGHAPDAAKELAQALNQFPRSRLAPEMRYDRAVALLRAGDQDAALGALDEFIKRDSDHVLAAEALQLAAAVAHQAGRYDLAIEHCRAFVERFPKNAHAADAAFIAAESQLLGGHETEAVAAYRGFLEQYKKDPRAAKASLRLGLLLVRQGHADEARALLGPIVRGKDTPEDLRPALLLLGDIAFDAQDWPAAERYLADYLGAGDQQPSADEALLKLALARQRQSRPAEAVPLYDRLLGAFPKSPHRLQALFECAQALLAMNQPDQAAKGFAQVLSEGPESRFAPYASTQLGTLALSSGDVDAAIDGLTKAAAKAAGTDAEPEALFQQALALGAAGRNEEAAAVFDRLLKDYPAHARVPEGAVRGAIARARIDKPAQALEAIEEAQGRYSAKVDPRLREALAYEWACCLKESGRKEDAERAYRELLESGAKAGGDLRYYAMVDLAEIEAERDDCDGVAELLRAVRAGAAADRSAVPAALNARATYRLGVCAFKTQKFEDAAGLMEEFLKQTARGPLAPSASLVCGESYFKLGRHQQAVAHLRKIVDDYPKDPAAGPAMLRLGECLGVLQKWPESRQVFAQHLKQFPGSEQWFQAQFGVGWAYENESNYAEALAAYRAVVQRHQGATAARAQFQIGECLFAQKQYGDAARELLKVDILYAYADWSAAALCEAGRCFEAMGDAARARAQYERVRDTYPQTRWLAVAHQRLEATRTTPPPGQ